MLTIRCWTVRGTELPGRVVPFQGWQGALSLIYHCHRRAQEAQAVHDGEIRRYVKTASGAWKRVS